MAGASLEVFTMEKTFIFLFFAFVIISFFYVQLSTESIKDTPLVAKEKEQNIRTENPRNSEKIVSIEEIKFVFEKMTLKDSSEFDEQHHSSNKKIF